MKHAPRGPSAPRTLAVRELQFAYEPQSPKILDGVTASVGSGALVGIVGPNGSGKSTLLRILCGLLQPQSGEVTLDGRPLSQFSRRQRARSIAFLPQSVNPAFALTVFEVVCLGRYPHAGAFGGLGAEDRRVVERCLRDTGAEALRTREFPTLSGGERQRVLLASILAQDPDLLLLDEPTSALDIHHQAEILALLRRLAHAGYGIGVVMHDLNAAARFCDALLLLAPGAGGVLATGAPESVLTAPLLSQAYGADITVARHPATGAPIVTAEPSETRP